MTGSPKLTRTALSLLRVTHECRMSGTEVKYPTIFQRVPVMKRMLMAVMAVAVAVTFTAPSFAADKKKEEKKGGQVVVFGEEKKKEEKKDHVVDTFADADKKKKEKSK